MKEYGKQQGTTLSVVRNGIRRATYPGVRLYDVGNRGCSLRVVWQFYRWLYRHSAWASRVRPSNAARQDEQNNTAGLCPGRSGNSSQILREYSERLNSLLEQGGAGSDQNNEETDKQESQAGEVTQVSSLEATHQPSSFAPWIQMPARALRAAIPTRTCPAGRRPFVLYTVVIWLAHDRQRAMIHARAGWGPLPGVLSRNSVWTNRQVGRRLVRWRHIWPPCGWCFSV